MSRKLEKNGRRICPGLWQLDKKTWVVRAQRRCPRTHRMVNRRRLVRNATRAEALAVLEELRAELEAWDARGPALQATSQQTLESFAISWLKTKKRRKDLAPSTERRYATALDRLSTWLREMPLADIGRGDIQQWMVASRKKFAARSVNGWLRVLRTCLGEAVADGLIPANPAAQVRPLKEEVDLEQTNSLPGGKLRELLAVMSRDDHTIHAAAATQAFTGLRWGELSALKWEDYEVDAHVLRIRRAVSDGQVRSITKTEKARTVGVPEVLAGILRIHRERLIKEQHSGVSSGLMFPSKRGTPLGSGRISDALRACCEKAGITRRFTSHGFRRSLTDLLRNAQVDPVVAAGLTGHETERMRKHYSTVRDQEAVDASERVARLVQPPPQSTEQSTLKSTDPGHEKGQSRAQA